jgi:hypothetical protein
VADALPKPTRRSLPNKLDPCLAMPTVRAALMNYGVSSTIATWLGGRPRAWQASR